MAALTRGQFEKLRTGSFRSAKIAWDETWTMDDSVQPLFPVPSCAVFGQKRGTSRTMPATVRAYSGDLPFRDSPEPVADTRLKVVDGAPSPSVGSLGGGSSYRNTFRNGATLYPRLLCLVERRQAGRLGANPSAPLVASRRTSQEKRPWKGLPGIENPVEAEFLRAVLLGESILPYRLFRPFEGVVPVNATGVVLNSEAAANRGYSGLHGWMRQAEAVWKANAESAGMTLTESWNHYNKLSTQFPIAHVRVIYSKAGKLPAACVLRETRAVIDHKLYWMAPNQEGEARYLEAILNSETARARAEQYQSRGQWGARDFDKVMFNLPIPRFEAVNRLHRALADAAAEAERVAAAVELVEGVQFQRARRLVRLVMAEVGLSQRIDALVEQLLDSA
jgi:hypothetical protein